MFSILQLSFVGFVIYVVAIEIIRAEKRNFEFLLVGFFFIFFFW